MYKNLLTHVSASSQRDDNDPLPLHCYDDSKVDAFPCPVERGEARKGGADKNDK